MSRCADCGSFAINHHLHGRDGTQPDTCDVCYWRKTAKELQKECERLQSNLKDMADGNTKLHELWTGAVRERDALQAMLADYIAKCQRLQDERDSALKQVYELRTILSNAEVLESPS